MYKSAGIRRVLTELEADNCKHRSNYTKTLTSKEVESQGRRFKSHVGQSSFIFFPIFPTFLMNTDKCE